MNAYSKQTSPHSPPHGSTMMKTYLQRTQALAAALCAALMLCACSFEENAAQSAQAAAEIVSVRGDIALSGAVPQSLARAASSAQNAARSAVPSLALDSFAYQVVFTPAAENAAGAQPAVTIPDAEITRDTGGAATVLGFGADIPAGTYTVGAEARDDAGNKVLAGEKTVTVTAEQNAGITIVLKPVSTNGGTGSFAFSCKAESGSGIASVKIEAKPVSAGNGAADKTFAFAVSAADAAQLSGDLPCGAYQFDFRFCNAAGDLLYSFTETVNIFENLTTDTWLGGTCPAIAADGTIAVTAELVQAFAQTTFFVDGGTGSDTGNGSVFAPFKTLYAAVNVCSQSNTEYTVYVSGTTEEKNQITISDKKTIRVKSLGADTVIKSSYSGYLFEVASILELDDINLEGNSTNCIIFNVTNTGKISITGGSIKNFKASSSDVLLIKAGSIAIADCEISGNTGKVQIKSMTISGSTVIDSQLSLSTGGSICVAGELTAADASIVATIALGSDFSEGDTILTAADGVSVQAERFALADKDDYYIDSEGKLCKKSDAASVIQDALKDAAVADGVKIEVSGDGKISIAVPAGLNGTPAITVPAGKTLTLEAPENSQKTISVSADDPSAVVFSVASGGTLVLKNISLSRGSGASGVVQNVVKVDAGGSFWLEGKSEICGFTSKTAAVLVSGSNNGWPASFVMKDGSTIKDCLNELGDGGAVVIDSNAMFIMNGGYIQNNTAGSASASSDGTAHDGFGGGVYVKSGSFLMNGGTIENNKAVGSTAKGGGIYISSGGICSICGGTVSNNQAPQGTSNNVYNDGSKYYNSTVEITDVVLNP
ncbi:MAG: hypothetical protein NC041_08545 [Bacteroides sp.]|nr:hypothetical protein [Prevotella sp.]MCM1408268.1 hypothetical protein [Treponema brennaborense]MCM1470500.1 hypothetical protein [Bacteroides sp.]